MADKPITYWDYIKVDELLSLQGGLGIEDDLSNEEVTFIVAHQIDELWFKLLIRELVSLRDLFAEDHVREQSLSAVVRGIRRSVQLLHQISGHFTLVETLTTRDYLEFRDKLWPASGFQSGQLREIEIVMGLEHNQRIPLGSESYLKALENPDGTPSPAYNRVARRLEDKPSLRDAVHGWLHRTPIDGSKPDHADDREAVGRFVSAYLKAHASETDAAKARALSFTEAEPDRERLAGRFEAEKANARAYLEAQDLGDLSTEERSRRARIRAALAFIESYRELPLLAWPREVLEGLVALEQAFVIFRQRHARMVERIIGRRTGTGGSSGVDYLDRTALEYRVFRDLWAVRTIMVRSAALPALRSPELYGFVEDDA